MKIVYAGHSHLRYKRPAVGGGLERPALPVPGTGRKRDRRRGYCRELLDELAEKLEIKIGFSAEQSCDTVADLLTFLRVVPITGQLRAIAADPDDDKVLECATVAAATHVVTGDRRHLLPLRSFQGIPIVTPVDFLAAVTAGP